jgi:FtsZ-interacting cell division protein ZipA
MEVNFGAAMKNVADLIEGNLENSVLSRVFFWAGLVVSIIVTILITVLLKRKLKEEMQKYRDSVNEQEDVDADGEDDDFGIEMESPSSTRALTAAPENDLEHDAASDDLGVSANDVNQISVAITTPQKLSESSSPKAKKASPESAAKSTPSATGLKNTKRSSKPLQQRSKPTVAALRSALSPPPTVAALAVANTTPSSKPSPAAAASSASLKDALPALSLPAVIAVDEEEILDTDHESELLIATKEV